MVSSFVTLQFCLRYRSKELYWKHKAVVLRQAELLNGVFKEGLELGDGSFCVPN